MSLSFLDMAPFVASAAGPPEAEPCFARNVRARACPCALRGGAVRAPDCAGARTRETGRTSPVSFTGAIFRAGAKREAKRPRADAACFLPLYLAMDFPGVNPIQETFLLLVNKPWAGHP